MKIKEVSVNNRKKSIEIKTPKGTFNIPFSRLPIKPTSHNKIVEIYVDDELGKSGVTYRLASGQEDSIHADAFLDYNRDPDYLRDVTLHKLTVKTLKVLKNSGLSKHEIIRRLETSPSQLYRLLDPTNYKKSIDEMLRLLSVLGCEIELNVLKRAA